MDKKIAYYLIAAYWLILMVMAVVLDGTGGDGDSVNHFLYAKYAFKHPENFFNHWAKPIFVMVMAPVAQLGFTAVKMTNATLLVGSLVCSVKVGEKIGLRPLVLPVLAFCVVPMGYYWGLSGLTEPLFAFWLMFGIYWLFEEKIAFGTLWLSFLPFVRSEGLIIFCVLTIFLLVKGKWKYLPLMVFGHLVLGYAGSFMHGGMDWVLSKIPYKNLDGASGYGFGTWNHYLVHFHEVVGPVVAMLVGIGLLLGLYRLIRFWRGKEKFQKNEMWLIYGMFTAFFIAHSLFWAFGIFNSYGLMRVFLGVAPIFVLIAARALEFFYDFCQTKNSKFIFAGVLAPLLVANMFIKQSWYDLHLTMFQQTFKIFADKHKAEFSDGDYTMYLDFVDGNYFLGIDPFDEKRAFTTTDLVRGQAIPANSWVIWDKRFSVVDHHISLEQVAENKNLITFDTLEEWAGHPAFYVFKRKPLFLDDSKKTLARHGFEGSPEFDCIQDLEGNTVFTMNGHCPYSKGLHIYSEDLGKNQVLYFSVKVKKEEATKATLTLVKSYEDMEGNSLHWSNQVINFRETDDWQTFRLPLHTENQKYPNSQFKTYLWLTEGTLLVDDIEVGLE